MIHRGEDKVITDYWIEHYTNLGLCSLCGNSGIVDTRKTAKSAAGVVSGRLNWCICPNGQIMRQKNYPDNPDEEEYNKRAGMYRGGD